MGRRGLLSGQGPPEGFKLGGAARGSLLPGKQVDVVIDAQALGPDCLGLNPDLITSYVTLSKSPKPLFALVLQSLK